MVLDSNETIASGLTKNTANRTTNLRTYANSPTISPFNKNRFNYDNLIAAIHILRERNGLNFPTDGITVSTVGPVNQLKKLRE